MKLLEFGEKAKGIAQGMASRPKDKDYSEAMMKVVKTIEFCHVEAGRIFALIGKEGDAEDSPDQRCVDLKNFVSDMTFMLTACPNSHAYVP